MNYDHKTKHRLIDAHIHFDKYDERNQLTIINSIQHPSSTIDGLIAVSMDYDSSIINLQLAEKHSFIHPAFGYHPEQSLPTADELDQLFTFLTTNYKKMIAVGEVGLPYYLRAKNPAIPLEPYVALLESFIKFAKKHEKPIILHAVYEDADIVCDLLEKHNMNSAHFHWFKGSKSTTERMIQNGYYISVTPDCLYEDEIKTLIKRYPIEQLMVETDGPWPFTGPFEHQLTHPDMMHESIKTIAFIKKMTVQDVYKVIYENTKIFYKL